MCYNNIMFDETIITESPVGQRLEMMSNKDAVSYLMFNNKRIDLVAKITIGRSSDNDVVVDNKLASRYHAIIQKIKNAYFIKDNDSTNGTFVNGAIIPKDKYVKLNKGDKVTIGNSSIVIS